MSNPFRAFERTWLRPLIRLLRTGTCAQSPPEKIPDDWIHSWSQASLAQAEPAGDRPRLAMLCSAPPAQTGIASFGAGCFQSPQWRLDYYAPGSREDLDAFQAETAPGTCLLPLETLGTAVPLPAYDAALLHVGNSSHHLRTLGTWNRRIPPGGPRRLVYLHEAQLIRLWAPWCGGNPWRLSRLYTRYYPDRRFRVMDLFQTQTEESSVPRGLRPLLDLARPDLLLVNNAFCKAMVEADLAGWDGPVPEIRLLFHPVLGPGQDLGPARPAGAPLRLGHFGSLSADKGIAVTLAAVERLRARRPAELVLAGFGVGAYAHRHGLDRIPWVEVHDSPAQARLLQLMASVDAAVQLREATHGESSGVVSQLLGLGKPVVVSRAGSFAELGAAVVPVDLAASPADVAAALERALAAPLGEAIRALSRARGLEPFHAAFLELLQAEVPGR